MDAAEDLDALVDYQKSELKGATGLLQDLYTGQRDFQGENGECLQLCTRFFKTVRVTQIHVYRADHNQACSLLVDGERLELRYDKHPDADCFLAVLHVDLYAEGVSVALLASEDSVRAIRFCGDPLINKDEEVDPENDWRDQVKFE